MDDENWYFYSQKFQIFIEPISIKQRRNGRIDFVARVIEIDIIDIVYSNNSHYFVRPSILSIRQEFVHILFILAIDKIHKKKFIRKMLKIECPGVG